VTDLPNTVQGYVDRLLHEAVEAERARCKDIAVLHQQLNVAYDIRTGATPLFVQDRLNLQRQLEAGAIRNEAEANR